MLENLIDPFKEGIELILHPDIGTRPKMGVTQALKRYYLFSLVPAALGIVVGVIAIVAVPGTAQTVGLSGQAGTLELATLAVVALLLQLWVLIPIFILVLAGILHAVGKVLGMFKGTYANTATAVVYSELAPVSVVWLAAIPMIGPLIIFVADVYSIWIFLSAAANQHKTTKTNAFIVGLITVIILFIVVVLVVGVAAFSQIGNGGLAAPANVA
ncbi:MAG: YIP1 family protein [Candidatus Micrarchaeaceae archaeon]